MPPSTSFAKKLLRVTFLLSNNAKFQGSANNVLTLTGLRTTASLKCYGFPNFPDGTISIYGMAQSDMNALASLELNTLGYSKNAIIVEADSGSGFVTVFAGQILEARIDYSNQPDVFFWIRAQVLGYQLLAPGKAISYTGATDVAEIVSTLAGLMGATFQNDGVQATLDSPYFGGTYAEQLRSVVQHAGIDLYTEAAPGATTPDAPAVAVVITPKGQPRSTLTYVLSPSSGLVGYPMRDSVGFVHARALFNPAFRFGGTVQIKDSGVQNVGGSGPSYDIGDGKWLIGALSHTLEAVKFGGAWFSDLVLYPPGTLPPIS